MFSYQREPGSTSASEFDDFDVFWDTLELNYWITNGSCYRKSFPGATPEDIKHYCLQTLENDLADVVIICDSEINVMLFDTQEANGFIYIDNNDIHYHHIWKDGVHLNNEGIRILANDL